LDATKRDKDDGVAYEFLMEGLVGSVKPKDGVIISRETNIYAKAHIDNPFIILKRNCM